MRRCANARALSRTFVARHVARPEADFRFVRLIAGDRCIRRRLASDSARQPVGRRDRDDEDHFDERREEESGEFRDKSFRLHDVVAEERFVTGKKRARGF